MVRAIDINTKQPIDEQDSMLHNIPLGNGDGGGGSMLETRVAKLESDVSYIQRDIEKLQKDVASIDSRLGGIEAGITTMKTTFKATGIVVSTVFAFCAYIFGNYVSKILDALNGLVLK